MEKTKTAVIVTVCLFLLGCAMVRNHIDPAPPLREGEVPYVLAPGVYTDIDGIKHTVATNEPRWSVSEAMVYKAVQETTPDSKSRANTIKIILIYLLCIVVYIGTIWFVHKRK